MAWLRHPAFWLIVAYAVLAVYGVWLLDQRNADVQLSKENRAAIIANCQTQAESRQVARRLLARQRELYLRGLENPGQIAAIIENYRDLRSQLDDPNCARLLNP